MGLELPSALMEGLELLEVWMPAVEPELEWGQARGRGSERKGAQEPESRPRKELKLGLR